MWAKQTRHSVLLHTDPSLVPIINWHSIWSMGYPLLSPTTCPLVRQPPHAVAWVSRIVVGRLVGSCSGGWEALLLDVDRNLCPKWIHFGEVSVPERASISPPLPEGDVSMTHM